MTPEYKNYHQLGEEIVKLLDGTISTKGFAQLQNHLSEDAWALQYYVEFITTWASLDQSTISPVSGLGEEIYNHEVDGPLWDALALQEKNGRPVEVERQKKVVERVLTAEERQAKIRAFIREEKAMEEQERRLEGQERRKIRERELRRRQRAQKAKSFMKKVRTCAVVGTMAAMLTVIGYLLYVIMQPVPPAFVATLTDGVDIKWADPELPTQLDSPLRPGYMKLVEGYAEITFDGCAKAIIQAPVEIELQNGSRAYLQSGKLTATVSLEARGFTVNTPSASIIDLGTEFGVYVKEDCSSDIHVFEGKVSLLAGKIDGIVDKLLNKAEQIVGAGQARRIKTGSSKIEETPFEKNEFARHIPSPYELAIRKTDPIAYWNFDLNESKCHNQIEGKIKPVKYSQDVLRINNGPKLSENKENGALTILHKSPPTMRLVDVPLYRHMSNGYTILFWYRPLVSSPHSIITQDRDTNQSTDFGRWFDLENNGKLTFGSGTGMNNAEKYRIIDTSKPLPLDQWTFVVVTITKEGQGWLYINGQKESSNKGYEYQFDYEYQSDPKVKYADIVFGFFSVEDIGPYRDIEPGKPLAIIDELVVYDYALSEDTIRQLYNYYQP